MQNLKTDDSHWNNATNFRSIVVKTIGFFLLPILLLLSVSSAKSHFLLNLNVRIFHVEHMSNGLRIYLRTPMPYLVANLLGVIGGDGLPVPAPFTTNRKEEGKLVHYVDWNALKRDSKGLGVIAGNGIDLRYNEQLQKPMVEEVRVYPVGIQPKFATLNEAKAAFVDYSVANPTNNSVYVGDAVVDVVLVYRTNSSINSYALSMNLDPGLPGQNDTANLIMDHAPGGTKIFRARGLLADPITISRSIWAAVQTFLWEGVRHILEGLDHVLFVICLVLGANSFGSLAWRITGFSLGHSITLTSGFFGFVPSGSWFIPTVETGIALSIIYAAAVAVFPGSSTIHRERNLFFVTVSIGLLHGLGFSFVLREILQINSPDIWQSLAAFNVGVELGQLLIVIFVWPLFLLIRYFNCSLWRVSRWGIAAGCATVALFWAGERAFSVLTIMSSV